MREILTEIMQINSPDELMGLFFKYRVQLLPVIRNNSIRGVLRKSALISRLRKTDQFSRSVIQLIEELLEPAEEQLLERMKEKILSGEIKGLPLIDFSGQVNRVITPGIIRAEQSTGDFLDLTAQLSLMEKLLDEFPFPLEIMKGDKLVYSNFRAQSSDQSALEDWHQIELIESDFVARLFLPEIVNNLYQSLDGIETGENFDLRQLLDQIETELLSRALETREKLSAAAELVGLPRQTFNYRLNNLQKTKDD